MTLEEATILKSKYEVYLEKKVKYKLNNEYYTLTEISISPISINPNKFQLFFTFDRGFKKVLKSNSLFTSCNQTFFDDKFIYEK